MRLNYLLLLCIFGFFLGSCKNASSPNEATPNSIDTAITIDRLYPLTVGDYWVYDYQQILANGTTAFDSSQLIEIFGTAPYEDHSSYLADFGDGLGKWQVFTANNLLFSFNPQTQEIRSTLRYPMKIGETFILSEGQSILDGTRTMRTIIFRGMNDTITVPAGKFSCYQYDILNQKNLAPAGDNDYYHAIPGDTLDVETSYYSPGIGLVEKTHHFDSTGVTLVSKLSTYRVK